VVRKFWTSEIGHNSSPDQFGLLKLNLNMFNFYFNAWAVIFVPFIIVLIYLVLMEFSQQSIVDEVFKKNLFDDVDLLPTFREMVGLSEHTPFECIGEIEESRLLMKRCLERDLSGKALDMFTEEILSDTTINWQKIEEKYNYVYATEHAIPDWIFEKIKDQL
jgi:hypothetical protein